MPDISNVKIGETFQIWDAGKYHPATITRVHKITPIYAITYIFCNDEYYYCIFKNLENQWWYWNRDKNFKQIKQWLATELMG